MKRSINETPASIVSNMMTTRRNNHIKLINKHLSVISKRDKKDNIRGWMKRNIIRDYIKNDSTNFSTKILGAVYGTSRDCEAMRLENFIMHKNMVYDICHTDVDIVRQSVGMSIEYMETMNLAVSSVPHIMCGALTIQLVLMGARGSPTGFGSGTNMIQSIKVQKGKEKSAKKVVAEPVVIVEPVVIPEEPVFNLVAEEVDSWEDL